MKTLLSTLLIFVAFAATSQIKFNTGDSGFDAELVIMNDKAKTDLASFKKELMTEFNQTESAVSTVLKKVLEPAEAFLTLKIASIVNKPTEDVLKSYAANKDKGWGAIAKDLGIKPGSPEFHALKGKPKKANGNGNGNGKPKGNSKK